MKATAEASVSSEAAPEPSRDWEEPNCLLCGHDGNAVVARAPDPNAGPGGPSFTVVRCLQCGLCYTRPRPDAASISGFYRSDYRPHRRRLGSGIRAKGAALVERRVLPWHGEGRLLDFGCGAGIFLQNMADQGWRVLGLDQSPSAVEFIQSERKLPALVGSLPEPRLADASFDVVTMWHSLEHVHQPLVVLRDAFRLLVPGGKLVVATPNIESWPFRWFGRDWFGLDLPRHLTHFGPQQLRSMVERAGFRAGPVRMIRHSQWLQASAQLACRRRCQALWQRLLTWKPLASLGAWGCELAGRSDCMMVEATRPSVAKVEIG